MFLCTKLSATSENAPSQYWRDGNGHGLEGKEFGIEGTPCPLLLIVGVPASEKLGLYISQCIEYYAKSEVAYNR